MQCALIAKDSSLVICEYATNDCSLELKKKLRKKLKKSSRPLDKFHTKKGDLISIKNDVIIFACAASTSIKEERLPQFLDELKESFNVFYKIGLDKVHQQKNLKENILDLPFKKSFEKLFAKYNTGINMSTIQEANSKVNDLKVDLGNVIKKQYDSTKATADFQDTTETIKNAILVTLPVNCEVS